MSYIYIHLFVYFNQLQYCEHFLGTNTKNTETAFSIWDWTHNTQHSMKQRGDSLNHYAIRVVQNSVYILHAIKLYLQAPYLKVTAEALLLLHPLNTIF